jgi:lysophospholipase L1-like esterase
MAIMARAEAMSRQVTKGECDVTRRQVFRWSLALALLSSSVLGCASGRQQRAIRATNYQETIPVDCVGDSITFGAGIKDRGRYNYPRQLGRLLGAEWEVRNLGVSGATLLKNGDKPYWEEEAFDDALAYDPHVVVIKLGTNDTKPQNWTHSGEFAADYADMIGRFRGPPSKPRIWACLPVPAYPERWGISDERIRNGVVPLVRQVARDTEVQLIDLYRPLSNKAALFPDRIHPNAEGARLIAEQVYKALTGRHDPPRIAKVLLIGDSISIGYFEPTEDLLYDKADVFHNPGNAQHTAFGLEELDEWLDTTAWDVIHFNHGLHDMKYVDETGRRVNPAVGKQMIPIDQYERNLEELTIRLKKTGVPLIFATTTPVPEGAAGRVKGDAVRYNKVALDIMARHGVVVNDLYTFALARLDSIQRPRNVHFTEEGSRLLAEQVASHVLKALEE